jgi:RimJ/RimL family protein N-acetyltransferase
VSAGTDTGRSPSLRGRAATLANRALARAGLRLLPAHALELRLPRAVGGRHIPFPAAGLSDDAVALRPLTDADGPVLRQFTDEPPTAWLEEHATLREVGLALDLAVADSSSGAAVGVIQLQRFDWPNHRASVGLWLLPEARGRGLMTRGLCLLVGWVFREGLLDRVEYLAQLDNERSIDLATRCGFAREGELRSCLVSDRRRHDAVLLAALRDDWAPGGAVRIEK